MKVLYATNIEQYVQYICIFARSYIELCLSKLGWESSLTDSSTMVPLTPAVIKTLRQSPGSLDPVGITALADTYGFQYPRRYADLRFDIAPSVPILCKFNEHTSNVHFLAAKNFM